MRSLPSDDIEALLREHHSPVRLATQSPNGYPLISTLWCLYGDQCFWFSTHAATLMWRSLAANSRCAFEVGLTGARYKRLRGQGDATLDLADGARITERMIARHIGDATGEVAQIPTEYAIRIRPRWVRGWGRA